jgi:methylaspartate mutase epsilon subunit
VAALEYAAAVARDEPRRPDVPDTGIRAQAKALVDNVVSLDDDLGRGLLRAFANGQLDVPYCLHPDNPGRTRGYLDHDGQLHWQRIGSLPIGDLVELPGTERMTSAELLGSLRFIERKFDHRARASDITLDADHRPILADHRSPA